MVQRLDKLDALTVRNLAKPGRYGDGGKLWLVVSANGAKRWAFIYRSKPAGAKGRGRLREMGLGSIVNVSIKKARQKAAECRDWLADGKDPIAEARREAAPTFGVIADRLIATRETALRSDKSVARLNRALGANGYVKALRPMQVDEIGTEQVLAVLRPIWRTIPGTAPTVRAYVKDVLDAAAQGFRNGANPATWDGHLEHLLAPAKKLSRGHHAAMAYADVPDFITELRARDATAALALEFLILTAARSGEVTGAQWTEVDLKAKVWNLPGDRMKSGRPHRVPLSERAVAILTSMPEVKTGNYVFAGQKQGKDGGNAPLSNMAFSMLLRRMTPDKVTTHGFRSAFRDWAGSVSPYPRELAEEALAHAVGNDTERAYRRDDSLEKRRIMMKAWASYCEGDAAGTVIALRR